MAADTQLADRPGIKMRRAREEREISLTMMAELVGVDKSYISRIENGRQNPSLKVLMRIAKVLQTDPLDFMPSGPAGLKENAPDRYVDSVRRVLYLGIFGEPRHGGRLYATGTAEMYRRSRRRYRYIENAVNRLLTEYDEEWGPVVYPPVPVEEIATRLLGLRIRKMKVGDRHEARGYVNYISKIIYINLDLCTNHELVRYTIGHEIGHVVLHALELTFVNGASSFHEREAQAFSARLLMPNLLVKELAQRINMIDPVARYAMAQRFEVSLEAMEYRLCALDFLSRRRMEQDRRKAPIHKRREAFKRGGGFAKYRV